MSIGPRKRVEVVDTNYPLSRWDRHTHTDGQTDSIIDTTTKVKTYRNSPWRGIIMFDVKYQWLLDPIVRMVWSA